MKKRSMNYRSHILIQKFDDGYYAECPALDGCYTQGYTHEEAVENIKDAIRLHVLDRVSNGDEVPKSKSIDWANIKVFLAKIRQQLVEQQADLQQKIDSLDKCYMQIKA